MARKPSNRSARPKRKSRDYEVGYRRPPKHAQFKKGQSGNPRGRPKGHKNFKADLEEELLERIQINEGGTRRVITKQRGILKRIFEKALKGDIKASELVFRWVANMLGLDQEAEDDKPLSDEDQAVIDHFIDTELEARGKRSKPKPKRRKK